jgi:hypothetical protein
VTDSYLSDYAEPGLRQASFVQEPLGWIKVNLQGLKDRRQTVADLTNLGDSAPGYSGYLNKVKEAIIQSFPTAEPKTHMEMERLLWPVKIMNGPVPNFLVPIQPHWAMHLFDHHIASHTLFGPDPQLSLNIENVYYRAANPYVLSAPCRILWYVSKAREFPESMHVRACSYVKEIEVALPKEIFGQYRRLGVYNWNNMRQIVKGDLGKPVMGFLFSHTELFPQPIQWRVLQDILYENEGKGSQVQSPVKISEECFLELYKYGMRI